MGSPEETNGPRYPPFLILRPNPHTVAYVIIGAGAAVVAVETAVDFDPDTTYFDLVYSCKRTPDQAEWRLLALGAAKLLASGEESPQRGFFSKRDFEVVGHILRDGADLVIQYNQVPPEEYKTLSRKSKSDRGRPGKCSGSDP